MNTRFLDLAEQEIDEAFLWYNDQADDLGYEFLDEVDRSARMFKLIYPSHRRRQVSRQQMSSEHELTGSLSAIVS